MNGRETNKARIHRNNIAIIIAQIIVLSSISAFQSPCVPGMDYKILHQGLEVYIILLTSCGFVVLFTYPLSGNLQIKSLAYYIPLMLE